MRLHDLVRKEARTAEREVEAWEQWEKAAWECWRGEPPKEVRVYLSRGMTETRQRVAALHWQIINPASCPARLRVKAVA